MEPDKSHDLQEQASRQTSEKLLRMASDVEEDSKEK